MRAGPLSKPEIVSLLNSYFVPVYAGNEDYRERGPKPALEKAEYNRIYREALNKKLSAGTVHVYITSPNGEVVDSSHVAEAAKPAVLKELLERNITKFHTAAGKALVAPKAQAACPPCDAGSLKLHLVARSLDGKGAWSEIPSEDWIVFVPPEAKELFLEQTAKIGERWKLSRPIAEKLFTHFYPATENNDTTKNKFDRAELNATLVEKAGNRARIRLEGDFSMEHSFYHKSDGKRAEGKCIGYFDYDLGKEQIASFYLATEEAHYNGGKFGVAVRSE
jgi:hypothetical protein